MSTFERFLTLWVALCIVAGVALGHFMPGAFHAIGAIEIARVKLPMKRSARVSRKASRER